MTKTDDEQPLVIGVGASAGGLEALMQLLEPAPLPFGAAIIIVQHLAPDHRSLMVELLDQHTRLRVVPAVDGTPIEADTVYVIQPRTLLRVEQGKLRVAMTDRHNLRPIDVLFESMAGSCGVACAGVVLSGTGQDGTLGLGSIKSSGGLTVAQRPETARFDGMPQAALASGCVDLMLSPDEMLAEIRSSLLDPEPLFGSRDPANVRWLGSIFAALRTHTGIDFSHYKLGTIARRVERRIEQCAVDGLMEYAKLVQDNPGEATALQRDLLIGVTAFMRDPDAIEVLRQLAIPRLLGTRNTGPMRVWVTGCSTGEEAYSIAMLLDDALRAADSQRELKVFATDIDERALEHASQGRFTADSIAAIPAALVDKYLTEDAGGYVVDKTLREKLLFSRHNVIVDPPFPRIDLVTCRNLLIYLKPHIQQRVLNTLSSALISDGLLWLGSSETLGATATDFEVLDQRWKLYSARPNRPRRSLSIATATIRRDRLRPQRTDPAREIAEALLRGISPPTLVVEEGMQLAYRYGDVSSLLDVPVGRATLDLRELLPHGLAAVVSMACQRVRGSQEPAVFRQLSVEHHDGTRQSYELTVHPIHALGRLLIALVFRPSQPESGRPSGDLELDSEVQLRMSSLERELRESQAHLQTTVEELESSNEELQATNEELVASNEELQSTNEELQSVNEELHTINTEHSQRLDELVRITQDLDQLLSTLDVGIVFLDTDLTIRRFNKRASVYISVLPQDVGRPLMHLTHSLEYPDLLVDCGRVLDSGEPLTQVVRFQEGQVRVRIHAFSAPANSSKGLVITFADVGI